MIIVKAHDQLTRITAFASTAAPHAVPLYRAAAEGLIALIVPFRESSTSFIKRLDQERRPALVLLGDDDHTSTGPDGWNCADRLARWGRHAIVHGAAGDQGHYAAAVVATLVRRRLIFVETASACLDSWQRLFAARMPVATIRPPPGLMHPGRPRMN